MNKFLIVTLLVMCVIGFSMSSVCANPTNTPGTIDVQVAKYMKDNDKVNGIRVETNLIFLILKILNKFLYYFNQVT